MSDLVETPAPERETLADENESSAAEPQGADCAAVNAALLGEVRPGRDAVERLFADGAVPAGGQPAAMLHARAAALAWAAERPQLYVSWYGSAPRFDAEAGDQCQRLLATAASCWVTLLSRGEQASSAVALAVSERRLFDTNESRWLAAVSGQQRSLRELSLVAAYYQLWSLDSLARGDAPRAQKCLSWVRALCGEHLPELGELSGQLAACVQLRTGAPAPQPETLRMAPSFEQLLRYRRDHQPGERPSGEVTGVWRAPQPAAEPVSAFPVID